MEFNYGLERKRFERQWNKLRRQYRKAGMDEKAIAEMYAFDLELFNDERAITKWEQPFTSDVDESNNDESTLFQKFIDALSYSDTYHLERTPYPWLEQITNSDLLMRLSRLSDFEIEFLNLYVFEGFIQVEVGEKLYMTQPGVSYRLASIGKKLFPQRAVGQ